MAARLLGAIILGVLAITAAQLRQDRSAAGTSTPPAPTATTQPSAPVDISMMRPYAPSSVWNTSIDPTALADANSNAMIATLGLSKNGGAISSNASRFSYPVYFADRSTPRWDLDCRKYDCTVVTSKGTVVTSAIKDVPIPDDAKPSAGTDGNVIVIDRVTGAEYNLWQAKRGGYPILLSGARPLCLPGVED